MARPTSIVVSESALADNLATARRLAPSSRVWAVVKANAYGHGLEPALVGFSAADGLALVEFDAAQDLRALGWRRPILMLEGAFDVDDVRLAAGHNLALVVHSQAQLQMLLSADAVQPIDVYLKFNSGMNRLGFDASEFRRAHARLLDDARVRSLTLMTHFANADLPGGADRSKALFDAACEGLPGDRTACNSAAVFDLAQAQAHWIRPGIMLYGASPFSDRSAASLGLRSAMRLISQLIATQDLQPGDSVGYGSAFTATAPMRIGVVACGYADGYPRHAPSGTPIQVAGRRTRTVGRVAMDMLMVDLSGLPDANIGSEVELWGDSLPIDEVAQAAGTIGYELMCAITPRVQRLRGS